MIGWCGYRLFAIDLDGTLVRSDQTIGEADRAAVAQLRRSGVEVVVVTGRFPAGARPIACELSCEQALICADGAVLLERNQDATLHALEQASLMRIYDYARASGLRVFALGSERVHFASHDESFLAYVDGWARGSTRHRDFLIEHDVVCVLLLGEPQRVKRARLHVATYGVRLDLVPLTADIWALRARRAGVDKGSALRAFRRRRGFSRSEVVAVGNDWNDLPLFRAAGRSFAMRDAPPEVRMRADHALRATADRGGAIAEVLARIAQAGGGATPR